MKLVEIILLLGSHCISPVEHAPQLTVAGKVPCAVLIHRDTEAQSVVVIPAAGADNPVVRQVLARGTGNTEPVQSLTSQPADGGSVVEAAVIPSAKASQTGAAEPSIAIGKQDTLRDDGALPAPSAVVNVEWPPEPDVPKAEDPTVTDDASAAADEPDAAQGDAPIVDEAAADAQEPVEQAEPAAAKAKPKPSKTKSTSTATNSKLAEQTRNLKTVCRYPRVAKWYKNKSGRLKYRCVKAGKQGVY